MKPLADAHPFREVSSAKLWGSILLQQTHVVMAVIGATLCLFVPGGGYPSGRKIEKAVPMNAFDFAEQKLSHPLESENLYFLGAEGRCSNFRDPYRPLCHSLNLFYLVGPLIYLPMVPVKGKSVHRDHIHRIKHPVGAHELNKIWIDRRNTAQHNRQLGIHTA